MAPQSNPPYNPMLSPGSQENYFSGNANSQVNQPHPGSTPMNRDQSSQSDNSWISVGSTTDSFATETYDFIQREEFLPEFKQESDMAYNTFYGTFGDQFNNGPSPSSEPVNSFDTHLETYHPSSSHFSSGIQQADVLSMVPRNYPPSFDDRSLTPDKPSAYSISYRTQPTQSLSRTSSQNNPSTLYPPAAYLSSNSQNTYVNDQPGEKHTPESLGWEPNTELVKKYKLILEKDNWHLQILEMSDISSNTPERVCLEIPASTQKGSTQCPWPGVCNRNGEAFTRPADCERHLRHIHGPPEGRGKFLCSYDPCLNGRHLEAFTRKDHYRDHLRDFHQEDIGAAKGEKAAKTDEEKHDWAREQRKWLRSRKISANHWRCAKCLAKKWVAKHGWVCAGCNQQCEQDRIDARSKLSLKEDSQAAMDVDVDVDVDMGGMGIVGGLEGGQQLQLQYQTFDKCHACEGNAWVDNG
ncbi:hypothetical protein IFR05_003980, partial [Cadophora sp. M221]